MDSSEQNEPLIPYDGVRHNLNGAKDPSRQLWKIDVPSDKHCDQIVSLLKPDFVQRFSCEDTEEAKNHVEYLQYKALGPLFNCHTDVRRLHGRIQYKATEIWTSNSKDEDDVKSVIVFSRPDESYAMSKPLTDMYYVHWWADISEKTKAWLTDVVSPVASAMRAESCLGFKLENAIQVASVGVESGPEGQNHATRLAERLGLESRSRNQSVAITAYDPRVVEVFKSANFKEKSRFTFNRGDAFSTATSLALISTKDNAPASSSAPVRRTATASSLSPTTNTPISPSLTPTARTPAESSSAPITRPVTASNSTPSTSTTTGTEESRSNRLKGLLE